jgi:hypothetical protein
MTDMQPVTCSLCRRPLDGKVTRHHLYPQKSGRKKGRKAHAKEFPVVSLHKICHRMIHVLFSEKYLAEHLDTIEALSAHPEMHSFLDFIAEKPPSFDVRVRRHKKKNKRDNRHCAGEKREKICYRPLHASTDDARGCRGGAAMASVHGERVDHLGLMAWMIQDCGLIRRIDARLLPDAQAEISPGEAVAGMILNGLGFAKRPLSLTPQVCANQPLDRLWRAGVDAPMCTRLKRGRTRDEIPA